MLCDIVTFDLRYFLSPVAGFYLFTLQLIHFSKIRGLEWLKMCFYYSGIRIIMLLRYNKMGLRKLRACAGVYDKYTNLICVLYNKLFYLNTLTYKLKFG